MLGDAGEDSTTGSGDARGAEADSVGDDGVGEDSDPGEDSKREAGSGDWAGEFEEHPANIREPLSKPIVRKRETESSENNIIRKNQAEMIKQQSVEVELIASLDI